MEASIFHAENALNARRADGPGRLGALARMIVKTPALREAYADLLGRLRLTAAFHSGKSILVTSTQPNEGKTTVASCLAITAALAGQSVLLIDGDLRRPWLASATGIPDDVGLGELLEGRADAEEAIYPVELFDSSRSTGPVSVMGAGRKSPAFLPAVDWSYARTMFQTLSQRFGILLIDSPPILAANDALLLARIVDGVLLTIGAGSADRADVLRVKEQLDPIATPIIGAVLNQFDPKIHGRPSQPYHGYYRDKRQ